jgi:hypothetical protein
LNRKIKGDDHKGFIFNQRILGELEKEREKGDDKGVE